MALSSQQLDLRRKAIGMSELCRVVTDPWAVWYPKATGKSLFTGGPWGDRLEPLVAEDYIARRAQEGVNLRLLHARDEKGDAVTLRHPKHPWLLGTPDRCPVGMHCKVSHVDSVDTLRKIVDDGHMLAGLECKTNQAIVEKHADEADQWGDGLKAREADLIQLLQERCEDPKSIARDLMARYSLQSFAGTDWAGSEEDQWGTQGTAQMPRDYLIQCLGYADMANAAEWHLHRLRAGFGRFETVLYKVSWNIDGTDMRDIFGWFIEQGERFMRDHMHPIESPDLWKAPKPKDLEHRQMELARIFPKENGVIRPATAVENGMLEQYRDAIIAATRAEVEKELVELAIKERIADFKGLEGSAGKVSYGWRKGRTSVDAQAAVQGLCDILQDELKGRVEPAKLEAWAQQALAAATREGEGFRAISRPQAWTKGIEGHVMAEMNR